MANTRRYIKRIGGDWRELNPVDIENMLVDVYESDMKNGTVQLAVYNGIAYLRAITEGLSQQREFTVGAEDPDVIDWLYELRAKGL
jgi:hypothetical protein